MYFAWVSFRNVMREKGQSQVHHGSDELSVKH